MKSLKEIKATLKSLIKLKTKSAKEIVIKRVKEKSTWIGIITKVTSVVGVSLTGVPVEVIAGLIATYVGGMLTSANTTKEK